MIKIILFFLIIPAFLVFLYYSFNNITGNLKIILQTAVICVMNILLGFYISSITESLLTKIFINMDHEHAAIYG